MNAVLPLPLAASLSAAPAPPGAPDIRSIVPPQPYFLNGLNVLWLVLAVVMFVLAAAVLWWMLRRPRAVVKTMLTPRQAAMQRLRELETQVDTLDARTFGGAVADVLRVYVGAQYRLHPERQTSPEFLSSIRGSRAFSPVEHSLLTEFLESCDLLKFARADATLEAKTRLLAQARDFVEDSADTPTELPLAQSPTLGAGRLELPLR